MTPPERTLTINDLRRMATTCESDSRASELIDALLSRKDPSTLVIFTDASTETLLTTYRRRAQRSRRTGSNVLGTEALLEALENTGHRSIPMAAIAAEGWVIAIFLNENMTRIIGFVVGPDARNHA